jgi:RyR domain-containing protein
MNPSQIARVVHEANRALQIEQAEQADPTIPVSASWDELDPETAASVVDGVNGVIGGNSPEESHDQWVRFKVTNGWTLGPVKDEATKQHPLLVPYDQLPESQLVKDALFCAIVSVLAGA